MSDDPRILCEEACMLYGLTEDMIPAVTGPIAGLFIGELPLSEYPKSIADETHVPADVAYGVAYEVNQRIFLRFPEYFTDAATFGAEWGTKKSVPVVSLEEAGRRVFELEPWLLEKDDEAEEERASIAASREKLALVPALGKYPRLGEQQITKERIRVKNQSESVRPSLANWIRVYRDELGIGYHEPMVRGKFLFDSENGKHLTSENRERLNLVLRSIEENVPLEIDTDKPEIVFPEFAPVQKRPVPAPQPTAVSRPEPPRVAPIPVTGFRENPSVQSSPVASAPRASVSSAPDPIPPKFVPVSGPKTVPVRNDFSVPSSAPVPPVSNRAPVRDLPLPSYPADSVPSASQVPPQAPPRRPVSFSPAPPSNLPIGNPARPVGTPSSDTPSDGMNPQREAEFRFTGPVRSAPTPSTVGEGNISFSSSHSLPVETENHGDFSIRKEDREPLSSVRNAFGSGSVESGNHVSFSASASPAAAAPKVPEREKPSLPPAPDPSVFAEPAPSFRPVLVQDTVKPVPAPSPVRPNPFRIHPVSFHEKSSGHDDETGADIS